MTPPPNLPYSEWTALQRFYDSTDGQHWKYKGSNTNSTHWNFTNYPTNNPCYDQWSGVVCTCHHYNHPHYYSKYYSYYYSQTNPLFLSKCSVIKLVLINHNLTGTLTSQLEILRNLTVLIIHRNNIHGIIPTELGLLGNLKKIGFDKNKLKGTIPSNFGNLKQLQYFDFGSNSLTGTIPSSLGNLDNLKYFGFNSNSLTGTIPWSLGNLRQLEYFDLNSNSLTGTIPLALGNLNKLLGLGFDFNLFTGTIPLSFGNLNQFQYFDLSYNSLTGTIPLSLGNLRELQFLYFDSNSLTGTIPSFLGNLDKLQYLDLLSNSLTGRIPSSLGNLNELQGLGFNSNSFTGTIPSSLGKLDKLQFLYLYSNYLTGTIPSLIRNLKSLVILFLYSNKLSGSITNLFNSTLQINLTTIQLNNNQLTGTLPEEIFKLPKLNNFDAATNCFSGDIPYPTICESETLTTLILDGLHTATSCRQQVSPLFSSAYTLNNKLFNRLDPCLFTMNSLTTLHLSGNGLAGSLPDYYNMSLSLTEISLSHNLLTGTIPISFQLKKWDSLDLSFNRIGGILSVRFASQNSNSSLFLRQNRLSGNVPESTLSIMSIKVLNGNIFSCDLTKNNVPKYDSDISNYSCGSNTFDISYYVWLGLVFSFVVTSLVKRMRTENKYNNINQWMLFVSQFVTVFGYGKELCTDNSSVIRNSILVVVTEKIVKLMRVLFYIMVYIIIVLLTIYTANGILFGMYTNQYAWTVSVAFQSGNVAFGLTFSALFVLIWLLFLFITKSKIYNNYAQNVAKSKNNQTNSDSKRITYLTADCNLHNYAFLSSLTWTVTPILNVFVVGGVNAMYVVLYLSASSNAIVVLQIFLAMFKSFWNGIGYRYLSRIVNSYYNVDNLSLKHSSLQLFIRLINNIAIPCVVVAVINPDCFYNLIVAAPEVTSTYTFQVCNQFNIDSSCTEYVKPTQTTTFEPPFVYSFKCSSQFITYYAPAFVFLCMIDGFFVPFAQLVGVQLYDYGLKNNLQWTKLVRKIIPKILRIDRIDDNKKPKRDKFYPYFDSLQLFLTNFTYLGLIMTLGAVFPPSAASFFVTVFMMNCWFLWKVDRFVDYAKEKNRLEFVNIIEEECKDCLSNDVVMTSMWMIITISCFFYSLFLFDTLGDAVGVSGAYWGFVIMPLVPLFDYLVYRVIVKVWWSSGSSDDKNNNKDASDDNNKDNSYDNNVQLWFER